MNKRFFWAVYLSDVGHRFCDFRYFCRRFLHTFILTALAVIKWRYKDSFMWSSVTRLGEIAPLGQTFKNLRQTFDLVFLVFGKNFNPLGQKMNFGQIQTVVSRHNNEKYSCHLVTLMPSSKEIVDANTLAQKTSLHTSVVPTNN